MARKNWSAFMPIAHSLRVMSRRLYSDRQRFCERFRDEEITDVFLTYSRALFCVAYFSEATSTLDDVEVALCIYPITKNDRIEHK